MLNKHYITFYSYEIRVRKLRALASFEKPKISYFIREDTHKKKCFFSGRGGLPSYTLSGPTTKKNTFFMCVSSLIYFREKIEKKGKM